MQPKRFFSTLALTAALSLAPLSLQAEEGTDVDARPVPIKTPPPSYPAQLRHDRVEGVVAVRVLIDELGNVAEAVIAKSTNNAFEQPALDAVKNWKFKPATKAGASVKSRVVIPIKFTAED